MLLEELEQLLNKYSAENVSNTPDFILAEYITNCLSAFDKATKQRDAWYNVTLCPGNSHFTMENKGLVELKKPVSFNLPPLCRKCLRPHSASESCNIFFAADAELKSEINFKNEVNKDA
jgi:hypothetical protein